MLIDVGIAGKRILRRGVVENHALSSARDIMYDRLWQSGPGEGRLSLSHDDRLAVGFSFRLDPRLCVSQAVILCREYQKAAIRAGVLDRNRHQPLDQLG